MANGKTYGVFFPFRDSPRGDYLRLTQTSEEEVRADLLHLILTRKGSRYYLPDFGTRIYEFIFEPMDGPTFDSIKADVRQAVDKYIPNLQINDITIEPYLESEPLPGEINYEELGGQVFKIAGRGTEEYTAKLRIDYTIQSGTFESRDFVIINI
jgi:phage baseplate assembly protein W